jgi:hypothetical protein
MKPASEDEEAQNKNKRPIADLLSLYRDLKTINPYHTGIKDLNLKIKDP